jgi:hypothetical protein
MRSQYCLLIAVAIVCCLAVAINASAGQTKAPKPPATPKPSGALRLVPNEIRFTSTDASARINVFLGDTPAKVSQIAGMAFEKQGWMFKVSKSAADPAIITVRTDPNKAEDGSYTLVVAAGGQKAAAEVYVTLPTAPPSINTVTLAPHLELDPSYSKGATLTYKLEMPIDATYIWTINGQVVQEGLGETKLVYTFSETGPHTIGVTVKKGSEVIGRSEGKTNVTP